MDPEIEPLPDIPVDLTAVDVMADGSWVGVGGSPSARDIWFGGRRVRPDLECHFPLVCALDRDTAVLVDARAQSGQSNAWVLRADGSQSAAFEVGAAVQSLACVHGRLVVTHFDEGFGNHLHGMLVFDRSGALQIHYGRDIAGACDIVDCYAVGHAGGDSVLLLIYPDFPLAEVDLRRRTQRVWSTPESVHGASAISAIGQTIFFHGSYADSTAVHAWRRGSREAVRIASFAGSLRGLAAGWFLAHSDRHVARVRFETPVIAD
jgi:hypothetical protein